MNDIESLRETLADLQSEAKRLRERADIIEEQADELEEALHIVEQFIVQPVSETKTPETEKTEDSVPEFELKPLTRKLTRKEMVRHAAPSTMETAVGPKELAGLVNKAFNTKFPANHIRPIIWTMANKTNEAKVIDGRYWIPK